MVASNLPKIHEALFNVDFVILGVFAETRHLLENFLFEYLSEYPCYFI